MENKIRDERMYQYGPYMYVVKHGLGPGTLPNDVKILKSTSFDDSKDVVWTDRFLTTDELNQYDIYPETKNSELLGDRYNEFVEMGRNIDTRSNVFESLTDDDIEKLSKYSLNEDELSYLLGIFELISDEDKAKAFELIDALLLNKKLVATEEVTESLNKKSNYTRRLLGDI